MLRELNKNQGFTLIEIIIVLGIILLVSAIAIVSLLRNKVNANEAAALGNVQSIAAAIDIYLMIHNDCPASLNELATANPPYISDAFIDGRHQGYIYSISRREPKACGVIAQPEVPGTTGANYIGYYNKETRKFNNYNEAAYFVTGVQGTPAPTL